MSTLVGHFVSSPREREKRDGREEMKERDRGGRKINEIEETEEIKTSPSTFTCCKDSRPCPTVRKYQLNDTFASPNHPPCLETPIRKFMLDLEVFLLLFFNSVKVLIQQ